MTRVFVLAPTDKPIYSAAEFGEIVFIFSPSDRPVSHTSCEFAMAIVRKLESMDYDPATDYLLLVGAFVPLIVFVAVVCEQYIMPKALAFDIRQNRYYPIVLGIGNPDETDIDRPISSAT